MDEDDPFERFAERSLARARALDRGERITPDLDDADEKQGDNSEIGLCETCIHSKMVRSAKKSIFWKCERAILDPSFPKYPRLPVLQCAGFQSKEIESTFVS